MKVTITADILTFTKGRLTEPSNAAEVCHRIENKLGGIRLNRMFDICRVVQRNLLGEEMELWNGWHVTFTVVQVSALVQGEPK